MEGVLVVGQALSDTLIQEITQRVEPGHQEDEDVL
jgi:hypothetical protein